MMPYQLLGPDTICGRAGTAEVCQLSGKRVLVCITGASGAIYGVRLVERLVDDGHEVHLVVTEWGAKTLEHETGLSVDDLSQQVAETYPVDDLAAPPASGSWRLDGLAVAPCSMKTLAGIASGIADNLVLRAADCALKERRPVVLLVRESPLNLVHIRNMEAVTLAGAVVMPASPPFWHRPQTIEGLVDAVIDRAVSHLTGGECRFHWGT